MKAILVIVALAAVLLVLSAAVASVIGLHVLATDPNGRPIAKTDGVVVGGHVGIDIGPRKAVTAVGGSGVDMGPQLGV